MNKPFWKKLKSYFTDIEIETSSSFYNPVLQVLLSKGRYQLCTSEAVYSYEDKYINFYETFKKIDWKKLNINNVLLLGLGLASVPQMLEKNFHKNFSFQCVEIDEEIIRLADDYILCNLDSFIEITNTDAEIYVKLCNEKFDMIIIDIFSDNVVPEKFETKEFLLNIQKILSSDGLVLFNRLNIDKYTREETLDYFDNVFQKLFKNASKIFIKNNIILANRNDIFTK